MLEYELVNSQILGGCMENQRTNLELDAAVNRALAAMLLDGVEAGLKLMKDEQVPPDVMARLTLGSELRRKTDWKH